MKIAVIGVAFIAALTTRALAISESCPAQIQRLSPIEATSVKTASSFVYELDAVSPRTIDAEIIADTSGGWFSWSVSGVELAKVARYTRWGSYDDAASPPLGIAFPSAVLVRHAWVVSAKSEGDRVMGWDAQGTYQCPLPPFSPSSVTESVGLPLPAAPLSPPAAKVNAVATAAPFAPADCAVPFAAVAVTDPTVPPAIPLGYRAVALVDVTVDAQGRVVDATMRASSGSKTADEVATQSAATSKYKPGISYCQPVGGHALFRADFNPG
ncbi:MAG: hypothetical protein JO029_09065 [Candidatus Eremiobacteraeota bacterium]|nr:hypothetical protein [Candidatus Eremiobacteraeota bacterium]